MKRSADSYHHTKLWTIGFRITGFWITWFWIIGFWVIGCGFLLTMCGCAFTKHGRSEFFTADHHAQSTSQSDVSPYQNRATQTAFNKTSERESEVNGEAVTETRTADFQESDPSSKSVRPDSLIKPSFDNSQASGEDTISIQNVISSIHSTFPLLVAAIQERQIAAGNQTAAWGEFDTKLKGASESGSLGYYETYRNSLSVSRPLFQGGEVFGGYRSGRGSFQPWYLERQTNDGGEFKAGTMIPLMRNRNIDARRAALWRANYDRQRAEPEIRAQLIRFVQAGSTAYWEWVAAGRRYEIGVGALKLAAQRNAQLKTRVEVGDLDPPVLEDNLRAIAQREAKLIDLRRKFQQAGIKLSLFYRSIDGTPQLPDESKRVEFPKPIGYQPAKPESDIAAALVQRPELVAIDTLARRINVDFAEAQNDLLPTVNAQLVGSQDLGEATSSKRDKSEFELEAGVFVEVPVQRRKAIGKSQTAQGKLSQLMAKRRFIEDKIRAEILSAYAALQAAVQRLERARESKRLAEYMADVERRKFRLGESDLFAVVLREQSAIEAAEAEVDALLEFFIAKANYDAAMARDWPDHQDSTE